MATKLEPKDKKKKTQKSDDGIPKISLNIFLLKQKPDRSLWTKAELLQKEETHLGKSKPISAEEHSLVQGESTLGTLYIRQPYREAPPDWVKFIAPALTSARTLKDLKNKSISAILVTESAGRQFVIAFGHGRHMIDQGCIEYRFGIRAVLNTVQPSEIVSIDSQTFDASPKLSRIQTLKRSSITEYGVDPSRDLLRALAGKVKDDYAAIGTIVAGMDSFKTTVPIQLNGIRDLLKTLLARSKSKDYLKAEGGREGAFAWIDKLQHVIDPSLLSVLDSLLWSQFIGGHHATMWMAIPDIIDWEGVKGFAYTAAQSKGTKLVNLLDIQEFKDTFSSTATLETLKHRSVYVVHSIDARAAPYPGYRCIYAEVIHDKRLFVLNAGAWYQVEKGFEKEVDQYFNALVKAQLPLPPPFVEYDHDSEGDYNEAVALASKNQYALLDRKQIQYGGNHSSIEVCDLYRESTTKVKGQLVHVKRGRGSATLSHLFAQGLVSSRLLAMEPKFVEQVNIQLGKKGIKPLPAKPLASDYDVVFAIVDGDTKAPLTIPFFSKVNLQNCAKTISGYGYGVRLMRIPESDAHIKKSTKKTKAK